MEQLEKQYFVKPRFPLIAKLRIHNAKLYKAKNGEVEKVSFMRDQNKINGGRKSVGWVVRVGRYLKY